MNSGLYVYSIAFTIVSGEFKKSGAARRYYRDDFRAGICEFLRRIRLSRKYNYKLCLFISSTSCGW